MEQQAAVKELLIEQREASVQLHMPLADSVQQLVEGQAQAVEVEQQLQECFRLEALPAMPLQEVARKVGRPARMISQQLMEAYGQLRCGLRLEYYTLAELLHILQQQCGRLGGITALELTDVLDEQHQVLSDPGQLQRDQQQELFATIPTTFHNLESLDLCSESHTVRCAAAELDLLAPLSSCLTSLKFCMANTITDMVPPVVWQLTGLRHLSIVHFDSTRTAHVGRWLEAMACMPALEQLHLQSPVLHTPLSAGLWLPGLSRATPQLTSVTLDWICGWDGEAVSALQRGLPALRALSFELDNDPAEDQETVLWSILSALSGRKGLTSLTLGCTLKASELPQPVPASLQLTDWSLDVEHHEGQQTVRWLLEALPSQTALTRLAVVLPSADVGAAEAWHNSLLTMPCTLVRLELECNYAGFDAASLMEGIAKQWGLKELRLSGGNMVAWQDEAAAKLAGMTQLQVLELLWCSIPLGFLHVLATFTELRHLELSDDIEECHGQSMGVSLLCLHPLQQLTYLQLYCAGRVDGSGLAVVTQLGALQELDIRVERGEALLRLQHWLLPLPPQLRMLMIAPIDWSPEEVEVDDALLAAAKMHGCIVNVIAGPDSQLHVPR